MCLNLFPIGRCVASVGVNIRENNNLSDNDNELGGPLITQRTPMCILIQLK